MSKTRAQMDAELRQAAVNQREQPDDADQAHAEAQAALAATDAHALLTKAYALTHRMHQADTLRAASRGAGYHAMADEHVELEAELRAARDMITAELVRRCEA